MRGKGRTDEKQKREHIKEGNSRTKKGDEW